MAAYQVENQWGGSSAPWHKGNTWLLGGRREQEVVAIDLKSEDHGETLTGTITYVGEGPISVKAKHEYANLYTVNVQWGGNDQPWHLDGSWIIGGRDNQRCIQLNVSASNDNKELSGNMTYQNEGPIGFKANLAPTYTVENQWGGTSAPWRDGGTWVLSGRNNQNVIAMDIVSKDNGKTFEGTMTYQNEGPVGFKATQLEGNNYQVANQWGGNTAPWHVGGDMLIGGRKNQRVIQLKFTSSDGDNLNGEMTYSGEGAIGFKANLIPLCQLETA